MTGVRLGSLFSTSSLVSCVSLMLMVCYEASMTVIAGGGGAGAAAAFVGSSIVKERTPVHVKPLFPIAKNYDMNHHGHLSSSEDSDMKVLFSDPLYERSESSASSRLFGRRHRHPSNKARMDADSVNWMVHQFAMDLERLSEVRPADPTADFSQPTAVISGGTSYTRLWDPQTWAGHSRSSPQRRYFRHFWKWQYSTIVQKVLPCAFFGSTWAVVVSLLLRHFTFVSQILAPNGASAALAALTAPLALLLTMRTNAALGRLQEARMAVGRFVLFNRIIAGQLRMYMLQNHPQVAILAARHLAIYGWLLKAFLRGENTQRLQKEVIATMLDGEDYQWLVAHPRPLWGITVRLRQMVQAVSVVPTSSTTPQHSLLDATTTESMTSHAQLVERRTAAAAAAAVVAMDKPTNWIVPHTVLEESISNLEGVVGVCERILGSPIPPSYSRHLSRAMVLWIFSLPMGLIGAGVPMVGTAVATAFLTYVMVGLDEIGMEVENPFMLLPLQELAAAAQNGVAMQFMNAPGQSPTSITRLPSLPL